MTQARQPASASGAGPSAPLGERQAGGTQAQEVNPYPNITEEQWAAREPVRQLLENLLARQVETFEAQHQELLRESLAGPSVYERAAVIVPTHPDSKFMQRMEDSNCRQILRISHLLIRLRRHERLTGNAPRTRVTRDVKEKQGS